MRLRQPGSSVIAQRGSVLPEQRRGRAFTRRAALALGCALLLAATIVTSIAGAASPGATALPASTAVEGRVVRVLDGDSLLLRLDDGRVHGVRIAGIDAPEKGQPYADVSRRALLAQLDDRRIRLETIKTDVFGRLVGRVFVDGRDAGLVQLRAGLAWHFARYDADLAPAQRRRYAQAERQARLRGLGLWRDPAPMPPWAHRAEARRAQGGRPGAGAAASR
ncbi:MAG: thermonuclease family protein [Burkholderiaceae bacterium]|nr:thermonuclease family protein [Burkholderiaceae bacterium]MEB2352156.1 thermonuclease family protein [Burkholderiaceae bacterium]